MKLDGTGQARAGGDGGWTKGGPGVAATKQTRFTSSELTSPLLALRLLLIGNKYSRLEEGGGRCGGAVSVD